MHRGSIRRWLSIACLVATFLAPVAASRPVAAQALPLGAGYWHTTGTQLLDAAGRPVRIAGVTWYGMDNATWVPAGLDFQRYTTIMDEIRLLGYNTIRLPFSNELVERNPVIAGGVAANPRLKGLHALQVMDTIVAYAGRIGLKVILDDHRSRAARPTEINSLYQPLWYTRRYPESAWIRDWQTLALRYRGNDVVIGFDLRNEPHPVGPGPWDLAAYLQRSPTWGTYDGVDKPATDWRLAAERAGNAALAINPKLLIIVQGLSLYPDAAQPGGVEASWWGSLLMPVAHFPVVLQVPHQLVYSVHEWGPRKHSMAWFNPLTADSVEAAWNRHWGFILQHPDAPYAAPILLGEFGTCTEDLRCVSDATGGGTPAAGSPVMDPEQGKWFQFLLTYLWTHPELNWSFFAINGTNSNNCATDNGLLNPAWNGLASVPLQAALRTVQPSPGVLPARSGQTLLPGTATRRAPRSPRSPLCQLP